MAYTQIFQRVCYGQPNMNVKYSMAGRIQCMTFCVIGNHGKVVCSFVLECTQ